MKVVVNLAAFQAALLTKVEALEAVQQLHEQGFRMSPAIVAWFEREVEQA